MLTKEERKAIAERANERTYTVEDMYEVLFGREIPDHTSWGEDCKATKARLIDLCDTSNMVELPLDKDGEVIHIGDTVYVGDGEFTVNSFIFNDNGVTVRALHTKLSALSFYKSNELTHKKPVTIASLASDIKRIANQGQVDRKVYDELFRIAWALEKLGDSDD